MLCRRCMSTLVCLGLTKPGTLRSALNFGRCPCARRYPAPTRLPGLISKGPRTVELALPRCNARGLGAFWWRGLGRLPHHCPHQPACPPLPFFHGPCPSSGLHLAASLPADSDIQRLHRSSRPSRASRLPAPFRDSASLSQPYVPVLHPFPAVAFLPTKTTPSARATQDYFNSSALARPPVAVPQATTTTVDQQPNVLWPASMPRQ